MGDNQAVAMFEQANSELDQMGDAVAHGANVAGRLTMDTIIALRGVLGRHQPVVRDRFYTYCASCGAQRWPCPDAEAVLTAVGVQEDE